ncbi:MAG TPA: polyribonucleotide nucleotidyltransferase, partial [Desulfobacteraceae bacterium]|nr:polyribonucleotide nucleotidyltransferase [Desulfobacteraceae bacterium]
MYKKIEVEIGGKAITFETGKLAKQANGAVVVSCGDTMILVTAVAEKTTKNMGFLPLTIEYQERMYAAGRIPGSYFRREIGRPSEKEVLTCRLIDRPLRPLFPKGYMSETQVIITVFSADPEIDPDVLAINGASAALSISNIPWGGPIAAARVGYVDGEYVLNPTRSQLEKSAMDLVVAGTGAAVVMVEGQVGELSEEVVLEGIFFAHQGLLPLIDLQNRMREEVGTAKREVVQTPVNEPLKARVEELAAAGMEEVVTTADKLARGDRYDELKATVLEQVDQELYENESEVLALLGDFKKRIMRDRIVSKGERLDGRSFEEVRPIACEVGILRRAHGSALFTRGETQAMVISTLGSERDEQHLEGL